MRKIDIEYSILSTFLWSQDMGLNIDDAFILAPSVFTGTNKQIALAINKETDNEQLYSLLNITTETKYPVEWLEIAQKTPLVFTIANRLHTRLIEEQRGALL